MKVLVTGGAGFIGSHVVDALRARGDSVVVLDDLSTGRRRNVPDDVPLEVVDLRDAAEVARVVASHRPDAVSHQGAQTSVARSVREARLDAEVNVLGTLALLEASVAHGVRRFVLASTGGAIYGEVEEGRRASKSDPLRPISPYACSKLAAEAYVHAARLRGELDGRVLRYANVYGPRQDPHGEAGVVAIFAERLLAGAPITVNARATRGDDGCVRDYVHVADVVRLNLLALDGLLPLDVAHACTGRGVTTRALADAMAALTGRTDPPGAGDPRPGDLERSILEPEPDPALAARIPLEQGLADTIAWFRARPT